MAKKKGRLQRRRRLGYLLVWLPHLLFSEGSTHHRHYRHLNCPMFPAPQLCKNNERFCSCMRLSSVILSIVIGVIVRAEVLVSMISPE